MASKSPPLHNVHVWMLVWVQLHHVHVRRSLQWAKLHNVDAWMLLMGRVARVWMLAVLRCRCVLAGRFSLQYCERWKTRQRDCVLSRNWAFTSTATELYWTISSSIWSLNLSTVHSRYALSTFDLCHLKFLGPPVISHCQRSHHTVWWLWLLSHINITDTLSGKLSLSVGFVDWRAVWFALTKTKMTKNEKITNSLTKTKTKNDEN